MKHQNVIEAWNNQADEWNQWTDLGEDEKVEFAFEFGCQEGVVVAMKTHKEVCDSMG